MEKKVVISKRFRNNTFDVFQYIQKEFSNKVANDFLDKLEKRISFIAKHPEAGKASAKRKDVRCTLLTPHNQIFYRYHKDIIEILCLFDMRKNPGKKPY